MTDWIARAKKFITEVKAEMAKVSFPSQQEVISTTVVVLITSVIFALFLWFSDLGISSAYRWVQGAVVGS